MSFVVWCLITALLFTFLCDMSVQTLLSFCTEGAGHRHNVYVIVHVNVKPKPAEVQNEYYYDIQDSFCTNENFPLYSVLYNI